mmetsp:Transcript_90331/g.251011  ORF Transcript_90331/g.251011 Transcript_90331/m.251011 type:complete len:250 (+) Transcript_90331:185-934(+)
MGAAFREGSVASAMGPWGRGAGKRRRVAFGRHQQCRSRPQRHLALRGRGPQLALPYRCRSMARARGPWCRAVATWGNQQWCIAAGRRPRPKGWAAERCLEVSGWRRRLGAAGGGGAVEQALLVRLCCPAGRGNAAPRWLGLQQLSAQRCLALRRWRPHLGAAPGGGAVAATAGPRGRHIAQRQGPVARGFGGKRCAQRRLVLNGRRCRLGAARGGRTLAPTHRPRGRHVTERVRACLGRAGPQSRRQPE